VKREYIDFIPAGIPLPHAQRYYQEPKKTINITDWKLSVVPAAAATALARKRVNLVKPTPKKTQMIYLYALNTQEREWIGGSVLGCGMR
jgi:hypothetical protein